MSTTTLKTIEVERTERPWGWYEDLDQASYSAMPGTASAAAGNKVKRICVQPGQRISLQKHAQRAEHWVVVRGTARITLGQPDGETFKEFDLHVGQHCDIAVGQVHRLSNLGHEPVEIIEVQMGVYLGEDDITRLQDDFGRK
jgi:mannose-6-phosphate isomerase